jgi:hypothetical protein
VKSAVVFLLCLFLFGCGVRNQGRLRPWLSIPGNCILGGDVQSSSCVQVSPDHAECSGVIIRYACVKVEKP